ncbi:MAG: XisH family protein [Anaerolineae bacterium]|nr:XisH family protein [Anaerolineae bacterium]
MPALDQYHFYVVNALESAGWKVADKQFSLEVGERDLYPDILAEKGETQRIVVEVKTYNKMRSLIHQLEETVGQYILYQIALAENKLSFPLYLAMIAEDFQGIFSEPIGQRVIQKVGIKLIVIGVFTEEIIQWLE